MSEPIVWSNAKLKTWRRCPKMFEYRYINGLKKRKRELPLYRGDWLHQLLEVHYLGGDWRARHAELSLEFGRLFEEEREEFGDLPGETMRIMTSYLTHYSREDRGITVVDAELDDDITLPNGERFRFIIDLVVEEHDGGLWLWDHKTVSRFMDPGFMVIDSQLSRYFWAAERMGYRPLRGIIFNEILTKAPTVPSQLKNGRLTERQNLRCDAYTYLRTIKELGQNPAEYKATLLRLRAQSNEWFRRTRLPKDKETPPIGKISSFLTQFEP